MKPTKEIIGLRIISISDGTQVGVVKDIVINPQMKSLDFMIIDQAADYFGAKVIAFTDILGLGEFAVTISDPEVIQDVAQNIEAQNLLKQDIRVLGTKVLTKKGQLIGEVKEILIDAETGHIFACLYENDDQMHEVRVEQVITLGKELLIVEGESTVQDQRIMETSSENQIPIQDVTPDIIEEIDFAEEIDLVGAVDFAEEIDLVGTVDSSEEIDLVGTVDSSEEIDLARTVNSTKELDAAKNVNYVEELVYAEEKETGFNLFEQRQLQYFIGKRVEKDIILDNTEILRAGERITPEIVTHIITRSTLMEVTSHLQKN